jgi:predicted RNA binding protein YcfA (HicA-like mRNA interferase family)
MPRKDLLKVFRKLGVEIDKQRGSHIFIRHPDGEQLTIPVYDVPR